jgi:hypothetical protein
MDRQYVTYFKVLDFGVYYYPAWKHYKTCCVVICDRCRNIDLQSCIGYDNKDLCLKCVEELTNKLN